MGNVVGTHAFQQNTQKANKLTTTQHFYRLTTHSYPRRPKDNNIVWATKFAKQRATVIKKETAIFIATKRRATNH